jgi:hypothetical protein
MPPRRRIKPVLVDPDEKENISPGFEQTESSTPEPIFYIPPPPILSERPGEYNMSARERKRLSKENEVRNPLYLGNRKPSKIQRKEFGRTDRKLGALVSLQRLVDDGERNPEFEKEMQKLYDLSDKYMADMGLPQKKKKKKASKPKPKPKAKAKPKPKPKSKPKPKAKPKPTYKSADKNVQDIFGISTAEMKRLGFRLDKNKPKKESKSKPKAKPKPKPNAKAKPKPKPNAKAKKKCATEGKIKSFKLSTGQQGRCYIRINGKKVYINAQKKRNK